RRPPLELAPASTAIASPCCMARSRRKSLIRFPPSAAPSIASRASGLGSIWAIHNECTSRPHVDAGDGVDLPARHLRTDWPANDHCSDWPAPDNDVHGGCNRRAADAGGNGVPEPTAILGRRPFISPSAEVAPAEGHAIPPRGRPAYPARGR